MAILMSLVVALALLQVRPALLGARGEVLLVFVALGFPVVRWITQWGRMVLAPEALASAELQARSLQTTPMAEVEGQPAHPSPCPLVAQAAQEGLGLVGC